MQKLVIDDRDMLISPVCIYCSRWQRVGRHRSREPFPEKGAVPLEIWSGWNPHLEPFAGDNSLRFQPMQGTEVTPGGDSDPDASDVPPGLLRCTVTPLG